MKKILKYGLSAAIIAFLGYHSVYVKKLSEVKSSAPVSFDATAYVEALWTQSLPARLDSAVDIELLQEALHQNADAAFEKYTHALAIGNYRYALIKTTAVVDAIKEDEIVISFGIQKPTPAILATEFIYGHTLRDATGLIDLKDFPHTADLNAISEALNGKLRNEVIPAFKKRLKVGDRIEVTGAIELNKAHLRFEGLEIIPVTLKILP